MAFVAVGCLDGERPRANPFDPGPNIAFEIVAIKDTVRAIGDWALFHVKSQEPVTDLFLKWSSDRPTILAVVGTGAFRLVSLPASLTTVEVTVTFMSQTASAIVVIDP